MNHARRVAFLMAMVAAGLLWACGPKRVRTPVGPGQSLIALLPDPDSTRTGGATVSNPSGTADLAVPRASTTVAANQPPSPVTVMSEADVRRAFGDALSALPLPPRQFELFFRFDSDELTEESRALIPQILQAIRERPIPDVSVIGHTDTTGAPAANFDLGLKRANMVRSLLIEAGINASFLEVTSHGEGDLLVRTADEVAEPRNRRVDISVR